MGAAGLGVDMGYLRYQQKQMQNAADAAAVAAAAELNYGDYVTSGQTDAARNGFTDGSNSVTVAVNSPPTLGLYAHQSNFVEVIITDTLPTYFMKFAGISSETVSARAVGHIWSGTDCIYALSPTATDAVFINGTNNITATCGVMDDSNATEAFKINGNGYFSVASTAITGGWTDTGGGLVTPTPTTGVPPLPDPLSYLAKPTVGSCTFNSKQTINGTSTLNPGVYCGGINVNGNGNATFTAGLYIINGGVLTLNGGSTAYGKGVTFYVTGGASVNISGGDNTTLIAPTTGTYAGILIFQDRSDSSTASVSGTANTNITGALYFADAQLTYSGNNSQTAYDLIVAKTLVFNGNTTVNDDYTTLTNGSPIKTAVLAE